MEGNGPGAGTAVHLGVLMFSSDPVALDSSAAYLVHLDPKLVLTNYYGQEYGLGWMDRDAIELTGDDIEPFRTYSFDINRAPEVITHSLAKIPLLKRILTARPIIAGRKCTRCGACVRQCPVEPGALDYNPDTDRWPRYDYQRCIRCYCCQEICPAGAIRVVRPLLRRCLDMLLTITSHQT